MLATAAVISVFFVALVAWSLVAPPEREERLARRPEPPSAASDCCGGLAGGCPVCLAAAVVGAFLLGSWLDGE